jgi:lysophospholipase L1-like esterase
MALALLGALLTLELGLRVSGYQPIVDPIGPRWQYWADPELGLSLRPGFDGHHVHPEFDVSVRIDAMGLRDEPLGGSPRAVALSLGDSVAFGYGVEAVETYAEVLQRQLGEVSVVNAGVSSYGQHQQRVLLERLGPTLRPDIVISGFFIGNDLEDLTTPPLTVRGGLVFSDYFANAIDGSVLRRFAVDHSQALLLLEVLRLELAMGHRLGRPLDGMEPAGAEHVGPPVSIQHFQAVESAESAAAWERMRDAYAALAESADEIGSELVVVYLPTRQEVDADYFERLLATHDLDRSSIELEAPIRRLAGICEELGLELVDPRPRLTRDEGAYELFFPHNGHPTAAGHALIAEALTTTIASALAR